jgi:hypothetical protein
MSRSSASRRFLQTLGQQNLWRDRGRQVVGRKRCLEVISEENAIVDMNNFSIHKWMNARNFTFFPIFHCMSPVGPLRSEQNMLSHLRSVEIGHLDNVISIGLFPTTLRLKSDLHDVISHSTSTWVLIDNMARGRIGTVSRSSSRDNRQDVSWEIGSASQWFSELFIRPVHRFYSPLFTA